MPRQPIQRFGFHGLASPSQHLKVDIEVLTETQLKNVAKWCSKLGISYQKSFDTDSALRIETVEMLFSLTVQILPAAHVPIFTRAKLIPRAINSPTSPSKFEVQLPLLDFFSPHVIVDLYKEAWGLVKFLAENPFKESRKEEVEQTIIEKLIVPLKQRAFGSRSIIPILEAAYEASIPYRHLGNNLFQLGQGSQSELLSASAISKDSVIGARVSESKLDATRLLHCAGLPAAQHGYATNLNQALDLATQLGWPVVIKPNNLNRGEGVIINIDDETKLQEAFQTAQKFSKQLLVEKQVPGLCHRFMISNGKVLYVITRHPVSVISDGIHSVRQLIDNFVQQEKDKPVWLRKAIPPVADQQAIEALAQQGLTLESVPVSDCHIHLREIESRELGGTNEDVTEKVHPENLTIALAAADLFKLKNIGVDIISGDISKPWYTNGAIINEVNFKPSIGSMVAKKNMPKLLQQIIPGNGRIGIEAFVGFGGQTNARDRYLQHIKQGTNCFLINLSGIYNHRQEHSNQPYASLFNGCLAALLNQHCSHLVVDINDDEFLQTGLPFDQLNNLEVGPERIKVFSSDNSDEETSEQRKKRLINLLTHYLVTKK